MGRDYVIMWRQKAVPRVAAARGLSGRRAAATRGRTIRRDLEQGCKQLQGYHYPIVALQAAVQTLSGHRIGARARRGSEWTTRAQARTAIEMAAKYS